MFLQVRHHHRCFSPHRHRHQLCHEVMSVMIDLSRDFCVKDKLLSKMLISDFPKRVVVIIAITISSGGLHESTDPGHRLHPASPQTDPSCGQHWKVWRQKSHCFLLLIASSSLETMIKWCSANSEDWCFTGFVRSSTPWYELDQPFWHLDSWSSWVTVGRAQPLSKFWKEQSK